MTTAGNASWCYRRFREQRIEYHPSLVRPRRQAPAPFVFRQTPISRSSPRPISPCAVRKMTEYYHADPPPIRASPAHRTVSSTDLGFLAVKQGDGIADVMPIAHLYKTQVYQLAEYLEVGRRSSAGHDHGYVRCRRAQEEFLFCAALSARWICALRGESRVPSDEVAEAIGLTAAQVDLVFRDIDAKRRVTRYLHARPPARRSSIRGLTCMCGIAGIVSSAPPQGPLPRSLDAHARRAGPSRPGRARPIPGRTRVDWHMPACPSSTFRAVSSLSRTRAARRGSCSTAKSSTMLSCVRS